MKAPRTQKDVQKLAGSPTALRRFVSKLAERCLPFFDLLKGSSNKKEVNWSPECQKTFEEIKSYLSQPPVQTKAQPGEPLYLYLSAGAQAVGVALIREENGKQQPVYYICREENEKADILSKLVWNSSDLDCSVYFKEIHKPSIDSEEVLEIESNHNWMTPFINYLEEVLEGICGDHMSAKVLAHKIIRQGYYWPTIHQDAMEFVKKCKECQLFSNVPQISPVLPSSVLSPIPFAVWGIDIIGPFPRAKGDLRYLLVSIDYMTKWVEVKAMRTINQQDCIKFVDNILMRFGIPRVLVSDNGPQFIGAEFESYLQERRIKHKKSSVAYPQGNGQVEVTNKILLRGIEKRLKESKSKWPEELQSVLWSYRTTPGTSTGETPFKLAYGTEAMLPIEVGSPSHRVINFKKEANEEGLGINMELIDEVWDQAVERMEKYKEKTIEHFTTTSQDKLLVGTSATISLGINFLSD
ncbi:uncharacterized protein LOC141680637 [Apium graveolens]|uniref:uncharacterized protein LOC141680637 n=1 Tax=Apium graveolens TaxID=4045 RepID=UPI003D7BDF89